MLWGADELKWERNSAVQACWYTPNSEVACIYFLFEKDLVISYCKFKEGMLRIFIVF